MTASYSICVFCCGVSHLHACADVALRALSYLCRPVCGHSRLQKLQPLAGSWWFYSPAEHSLLHNWTAPRRQCCTRTDIIKHRGVNGNGNVFIFTTLFVQTGTVCSWMHLKLLVQVFVRTNNVPEIIAVAFSILWLSRVGTGVRRLSHTPFIYYTERQTGGEPGADGLQWGKDEAYSKDSPFIDSNS